MFISFALVFFILLGSVCASDVDNVSSTDNNHDLLSSNVEMELQSSQDLNSNDTLASIDEASSDLNASDALASSNGDNDDLLTVSNKKVSFSAYSGSTIIAGNNFYVKLLDEKGSPVVGKTISFSFNGKTYKSVTQKNGAAYLKLTGTSKYYTITYNFAEKGYTSISGKSTILLIKSSASKIVNAQFIGFPGYRTPFKVRLTADGVGLYNKKVRFVINGKSYYRNTDSKGVACIDLTYSRAATVVVKYYYAGEQNINPSSGSASITFKLVPTKITRANSEVYQRNVLTPFKVKVVDGRGNPASGNVVFTVDGKKYTRALNSQGLTSIGLRLAAGTHKVSYVFAQNPKYKGCSGSCSITVRSYATNNGFWLFGSDMKKVNLNALAKYHTKHIFLNYYALELHGKSAVETFIKNANANGIKVHIWMQCFYDGNWISPVNSDGTYKYSYFNSKINEAKKYAALKGVAGIHLDYLRFPKMLIIIRMGQLPSVTLQSSFPMQFIR